MSRFIVSVVVTCVVALAAFAGAASAGPAQPGSIDECIPFFDYLVCFKGRSVGSDTFTPSGNYTFIDHSNIEYTITYVPTGEVTESTARNQTFGDLVRGSELQVHHFVAYTVLESSYAGGFTCRGVLQTVWANGELRHEMTQEKCS
jgi:hypothetical protein